MSFKYLTLYKLMAMTGLLVLLIVGGKMLAETSEKSGEVIPPFVINTAEGVLTSDELKGQLVYLDFWASWCAPCRESFPWMNEMQAKYVDQGLRIVAVSLDKNRRFSEEFLAEIPADFIIGYDPQGKLANQFGVVGMPMAFIIDREGLLVEKHVGFRRENRESYEESLREHL